MNYAIFFQFSLHRITLFALVLFCCCCCCPSTRLYAWTPPVVEEDKILQQSAAITSETNPADSSILLYDLEIVTVNEDASDETVDDFYVKILTEKGRDENRIFTLPYHLFYNEVELQLLEVIKPDGRRLATDLSQQQHVIDANQMQSNIFDPNSQVLKLAVPELEVNDILHTRYRYRTKRPRATGIWSAYQTMQSDNTILNYTYIVNLPKTLPLAGEVVKDEIPDALTRAVVEENDRTILIYTAKNVPPLLAEPDMPPLYACAMRILLSTAPDWETVSRWYAKLCETHLAATTPDMQTLVDALVADSPTADSKINAVYRYVATQIRYMGLTLEETSPGYEPHDVALTFTDKGGVCRDKAALLVSLLRLAGLDANMVLIHAGYPKDAEVANTYFNHAIVGVRSAPDAPLQLLDPTAESNTGKLPGYLNHCSYLVASGTGETLQVTPDGDSQQHKMQISTRGDVSGETGNAVLHTILQLSGIHDEIYRGAFSQMQAAQVEQFFARTLSRILPGATIKKLQILPTEIRDLSQPLRFELDYEIPNFLDRNAPRQLIAAPFLGEGFSALNFFLGNTSKWERHYPFLLESTASTQEEFTLTLPPTRRIAALPDKTEIAQGPLSFRRELFQEGTTLRGKQEEALQQTILAPAAYRQLKTALQLRESSQRQNAVAELNFGTAEQDWNALFPHAHDVILSQTTNIELDDAFDYRVIQTVERKILTYGGMKKNSELFFDFNPATTEITLSDVTVTQSDGTVVTLPEHAINRMDLPGSGSAPRYPLRKRLSVNLPSVAPGSMIRYTVTTQVHQSFQGFQKFLPLQSDSPLLHGKLTLSIPLAMQESIQLSLPEEITGSVLETEKAGRLVRTMAFDHQLPVAPERNMPPSWSFLPGIGITSETYPEISARMLQSLNRALDATQEEAVLQAQTLTENCTSQEEKLLVLRNFVAKNIREAGPELQALQGNEFSAPDQTLADGYGHTADRAILLKAMLRGVGIESRFIAASSQLVDTDANRNALEAIPLVLFDKLLLEVPILEADGTPGDFAYYLNSFNEYSVLGETFDGNLALDLENGLLFPLMNQTTDGEQEECSETTDTITIRPDGSAKLERVMSFDSARYRQLREAFAKFTTQDRERFWEQQATQLSENAKLLEQSADFSTYPGTLSFAVEIADFAQFSGSFLSFELPETGFEELLSAPGNRMTPYESTLHCNRRFNALILLPDGYEQIEQVPESFRWSAGDSALFAESSGALLLGKEITLTNWVNFQPVRFDAYELPALEGGAARLNHRANRRFLLRKP